MTSKLVFPTSMSLLFLGVVLNKAELGQCPDTECLYMEASQG